MTDFIPTNLTNQELFERVYALKELFLEVQGDHTYIFDAWRKVIVCFYHYKGNNELGLFLDCLYRMGMTNPTLKQTEVLSIVFFIAKRFIIEEGLHKDKDIPSIVKAFRFNENMTTGGATTFQQWCFIFSYLRVVANEKTIITQQDDGKFTLKKEIVFREPQ